MPGPDPKIHDIYQHTEALVACRRCGMSWLAKNGDYVGHVSAEAEAADVTCPADETPNVG